MYKEFKWKYKKKALDGERAAGYIGVSKKMLDTSRVTGNLCGEHPPRFIRIGKKLVRYLIEDLDEWLNSKPKFESLAQESSL